MPIFNQIYRAEPEYKVIFFISNKKKKQRWKISTNNKISSTTLLYIAITLTKQVRVGKVDRSGYSSFYVCCAPKFVWCVPIDFLSIFCKMQLKCTAFYGPILLIRWSEWSRHVICVLCACASIFWAHLGVFHFVGISDFNESLRGINFIYHFHRVSHLIWADCAWYRRAYISVCVRERLPQNRRKNSLHVIQRC